MSGRIWVVEKRAKRLDALDVLRNASDCAQEAAVIRRTYPRRAVRAAGRGAMISMIVSILVGGVIGGWLGAAVAVWVIGKIERREWR